MAGDQAEAGQPVQQAVDRDPRFGPGQRRADAVMNPMAPAKMLANVRPVHIESVRVREGALVVVRRPDPRPHLLASWNRHPGYGHLAGRPAPGPPGRATLAHRLLDRGLDQLPVLQEFFPVGPVAEQRMHEMRDQDRGCVRATEDHRGDRPQDLDVAQP